MSLPTVTESNHVVNIKNKDVETPATVPDIELPEIIIHQSKKVSFTADTLSTGPATHNTPPRRKRLETFYPKNVREAEQRLTQQEDIRKVSEPIGMFVGLFVVISIYALVNVELYKPFRECRDNVINDEVMATVTGYTDGFIEYTFDKINCTIANRGQVSDIGRKYLIYKSNNNQCSFDKKTINAKAIYCCLTLRLPSLARHWYLQLRTL